METFKIEMIDEMKCQKDRKNENKSTAKRLVWECRKDTSFKTGEEEKEQRQKI